MAIEIKPTQAQTSVAVTSEQPAPEVTTEAPAPASIIGQGTPALSRMVAGAANASMSLAAPGAISATAPKTRAETVGYVTQYDRYDFEQRKDRIANLAVHTGDFIGGLHDVYAQQELVNILWSTPPERRQELAQWMASTPVVRDTWAGGQSGFIDQICDSALTGAEWSSFSFFMYSYTAGFGSQVFEPRWEGGFYQSPDWWYASRPYGSYIPYWEYALPSYYYDRGYSIPPPVIITIPGRDRYESGNRLPGTGGPNRLPG